jgi:adenylate kinase
VRDETEIGERAKRFMERGELVPDQIVIAMVTQRIQEPDCQGGVVLDGFPRNLSQAGALREFLGGNETGCVRVVKIHVTEEELIRRLSGRRVCRDCGTQFHLTYDPPRRVGLCAKCGGSLCQREDDREETIRSRLEVYRRETLPLDEHYQKLGVLREVDGLGKIDEVCERIERAVGTLGR